MTFRALRRSPIRGAWWSPRHAPLRHRDICLGSCSLTSHFLPQRPHLMWEPPPTLDGFGWAIQSHRMPTFLLRCSTVGNQCYLGLHSSQESQESRQTRGLCMMSQDITHWIRPSNVAMAARHLLAQGNQPIWDDSTPGPETLIPTPGTEISRYACYALAGVKLLPSSNTPGSALPCDPSSLDLPKPRGPLQRKDRRFTLIGTLLGCCVLSFTSF